MTKRDSLLNRLGSSLSDSVGIRPGESTLPTYSTTERKPPKTSFVRSRSDGEISIADVMPDPDQPRKEFDEDEINRLAASIQKHGLLQAIRVRWSETHGKWIIVAGERRYRAHLVAGLANIKCHFDDSDSDETTIRSQQIIENVLRENLTGMELAKSLRHLMDSNGWNARQVGEELNISKGKVSKALSLLKLPEDVQAKIEDGSIAPSTAYQLTKIKDLEKQKELIAKAKRGHVKTVEATRASKRAATTATGAKRTRKTTNETFRTSEGVRVAISSRRDVGEQGMINALLEIADEIRKRGKKAA